MSKEAIVAFAQETLEGLDTSWKPRSWVTVRTPDGWEITMRKDDLVERLHAIISAPSGVGLLGNDIRRTKP